MADGPRGGAAARRRGSAPKRRRRRRTGGTSGRIPGSPSMAPRRIPDRAGRAAEQGRAAVAAEVLRGAVVRRVPGRSRSSPWTMRNASGDVRALADAAVPVRRWQRVQWQYMEVTEGLGDLEAHRAAVAAAGDGEADAAGGHAAVTRSRAGSMCQRCATVTRRSSRVQRSGCSSPVYSGEAPLSAMQPVLSPSPRIVSTSASLRRG